MELEINVISIPDALSAEEAKQMMKQYHDAEMKKDVDAILHFLSDEPWKRIRTEATQGHSYCCLTIGYEPWNACQIRERYGLAWLRGEGKEVITNLFSSFGYNVTYELAPKYARIYIRWAE